MTHASLATVRRFARLGAIAGLLLGAAAAARAQQTSPLKIGVVDVEAITRRSTTIQAAIRQAEQNIQAEQEKIDAKMREYQQLSRELATQRSVFSSTQISQQEGRLRDLRSEIDDMQYQINKQLDKIRQEVMDPEVDRIMKTVGDVARRLGYDLVIRSEAVLFNSERTDLTPLVIEALDRPTSASGSAAPTPTPTPARSAPPTPPAARP